MKPGRILLFIAAVLCLVATIGWAFPEKGVDVGPVHMGFLSPKRFLESQRAQREEMRIDSMFNAERTDITDSIAYYRYVLDSSNLRFWLPDVHYFDHLWANVSTASAEGRIVRILHYGDSQIEMDHITSRLRSYMQCTFGGGGPGMMPFRTITPSLTVRHDCHGELLHLASFGDSTVVRSRGNYGLMMQSFRLEGGEAVVSYKASRSNSVDDRVKAFRRITFIGDARGPVSTTLTDRSSKKTYDTQRLQAGIGKAEWTLDTASTAVRLQVDGAADLYCVLLDSSAGVAVDNIPMRGCSGQQFTMVGAEKLKEAYSQMPVGLIIMQFGGNSVPYFHNSKDISEYCRSIGRQIDHVHRCCPDALILFVGPSDMCRRYRGEMQTYPVIPELVDSLAATALRHGVAYWSIYHAMGGDGSMPKWVRQGLAGNDHIHFTQRGADMMGDMMGEAFDASYRIYQLEQRHKAVSARYKAAKEEHGKSYPAKKRRRK
jgi:hypothetical protein